jgi:hypothetical protein
MANITRKEFMLAAGAGVAAATAMAPDHGDAQAPARPVDRAKYWIGELRAQWEKVDTLKIVAEAKVTGYDPASLGKREIDPRMAEGTLRLVYRKGDYRFEEERADGLTARGQLGTHCYRYRQPIDEPGTREVLFEGLCRQQPRRGRSPMSLFFPILGEGLASWLGEEVRGGRRCEVVVQDQHRFCIDPDVRAVTLLEFFRDAATPSAREEFLEFEEVDAGFWLARRIVASLFFGGSEPSLQYVTTLHAVEANGILSDAEIVTPEVAP